MPYVMAILDDVVMGVEVCSLPDATSADSGETGA